MDPVNTENGLTWQCDTCGKLNDASGKFCAECGHAKDRPKWQCDTCGTLNDASGKFCTGCGLTKEALNSYECDSQDETKSDTRESDPKSSTAIAIVLIIIVSGIITAIMVANDMDSLKYAFTGSLSVTSFLPLVFGIIISIVVAALKTNK